MKIRTSLMIEEELLKKLKKEAIDNGNSYSELLNKILKLRYAKSKDLF